MIYDINVSYFVSWRCLQVSVIMLRPQSVCFGGGRDCSVTACGLQLTDLLIHFPNSSGNPLMQRGRREGNMLLDWNAFMWRWAEPGRCNLHHSQSPHIHSALSERLSVTAAEREEDEVCLLAVILSSLLTRQSWEANRHSVNISPHQFDFLLSLLGDGGRRNNEWTLTYTNVAIFSK